MLSPTLTETLDRACEENRGGGVRTLAALQGMDAMYVRVNG